MSGQLEKFVQEHREAFDDESPAPEVWDKIRDRMESGKPEPAEKKRAVLRSLPLRRWLSAAAVVLVCASGWLYFSKKNPVGQPGVALQRQPVDSGQRMAVIPPPADTSSLSSRETARVAGAGETKAELQKPLSGEAAKTGDPEEDDYAEEMYHYSRLVEIKHNELKTLQKDEPLLYKQFSGDVNKLDSVYQALKTQLPKNPNREQLIEAMIKNLQLQIGLLNKQLDIIKQIKHSKKSANEKAYQSV